VSPPRGCGRWTGLDLSFTGCLPQEQLQGKTAAALEAIRQDSLTPGRCRRPLCRFVRRRGPAFPQEKPLDPLARQKLFDVPFAALMERVAGRPAYVVERHAIQITPGAGYWVDAMARRGSASSSGRFLGIGDPIYNAADSRFRSSRAVRFRWAAWLGPSVVAAARDGMALPRLPASASELDSCARAWGGPSTLLEGARAARPELAAALGAIPRSFTSQLTFWNPRRRRGLAPAPAVLTA
jgi:hypothetical protein